MSKVKASAGPFINIMDGISIHSAKDLIQERYSKQTVKIEYNKFINTIVDWRERNEWKAATNSIFLMSYDPSSEGQTRFISMLESNGIEADVMYFRHTYPSLPPNKSSEKTYVSCASRLTYIAGLMSRFDSPQIIFVSHCFELFEPLIDLAQRIPKGKIGIAYFSSLLDYRWKPTGLTENKCPGIQFLDLETHAKEIIGFEMNPVTFKYPSKLNLL